MSSIIYNKWRAQVQLPRMDRLWVTTVIILHKHLLRLLLSRLCYPSNLRISKISHLLWNSSRSSQMMQEQTSKWARNISWKVKSLSPWSATRQVHTFSWISSGLSTKTMRIAATRFRMSTLSLATMKMLFHTRSKPSRSTRNFTDSIITRLRKR